MKQPMAATESVTFGTPAEWARRTAFATVAGAFMGVVGGFGTFEAVPLPARLAGWVVMFWAGVVLFTLAVGPAVTLGRRAGLPMWFSVAAALVLGTVPLTAITYLATSVIMGGGSGQPWLERYAQVLIVVVPLVGGYVAVHQLLKARAEPPAPPDAPSRAAPFLARLPARLGRDLLCLEMEDHYVRAHTPLGSDLILMRLRDAVAELEGVEGLQVHRSWWVARGAVEAVERDGRGLKLRLRGGLEAPVSRSAVAEVKAAGWLA